MVKHTQTILWLLPTNCLSVFDHFVGLAIKWLNFEWTSLQRKKKILISYIASLKTFYGQFSNHLHITDLICIENKAAGFCITGTYALIG